MVDETEPAQDPADMSLPGRVAWDPRSEILEAFTHAKRECLVVQRGLGTGPSHYCGYVKSPLDHDDLSEDENRYRVEPHGGITYGPDDDGWVGFDTAHAFDLNLDEEGEPLPGRTNTLQMKLEVEDGVSGTHWTPERVREAVEGLAEELTVLFFSLNTARMHGEEV